MNSYNLPLKHDFVIPQVEQYRKDQTQSGIMV